MKYLFTFLLLFLNWVIWSGMLDLFHLTLGVIACGIVTYLTADLLFKRSDLSFDFFREAFRFLRYIPWLLYQIVLSNLHVASLVLHPRMPIEPRIVRFKSKLKKEIARVTFANSITLTPGTITADIDGDTYVVHALSRKTAEDLVSGDMEQRVGRIFLEGRDA
jgi:multicomponent Na+:H+ antiporter subunit E